jgi:hypothetical protein
MSYADYYPLKYLNALFVSLHNLGTDPYHVAGTKSRDVTIWFEFNE